MDTIWPEYSLDRRTLAEHQFGAVLQCLSQMHRLNLVLFCAPKLSTWSKSGIGGRGVDVEVRVGEIKAIGVGLDGEAVGTKD